MTEDKVESKFGSRLSDRGAALEAIKRAQEKGNWPSGIEKQFPTPESRAKFMASIRRGRETITPQQKAELTEWAKKFNTNPMAKAGESSTETEELPHTGPFVEGTTSEPSPTEKKGQLPPYNPKEHFEAQGGAAVLKTLQKENENLEKEREASSLTAVERARAKIQTREMIRQAAMKREAAINEDLRPKTLKEMAASRRGDLAEKSASSNLREVKETGPLPPLQSQPPQGTGPKAEEVIRESLKNQPPEPPKRNFFQKIFGGIFGRR